ncbi:MAG TPA: hypothetical protein VIN71_09935 [Pseudomonadales bacterium]
MKELNCDLWSMLLPAEWFAEQEDETVMIVDEDEASIIEITPLLAEQGDSKALLASLQDGKLSTSLAGLPALYSEFVEDEMFWREWFCDAGGFVLAISHGCDESNRGMDDAAVDEMLATLLINEEA